MTSHYWWTTPTSLLGRYKSSSQKQMPKKKTINTNGIICLRQNSNIPFQTQSHSIWWTKKNGKKNLKLVFHLSVSPTTIHVVKLIPCLTSKHNNDKQTKNGDSHAIRRQTIQIWRDTRHIICPHKTKTKKFLNDTRETSLLTALLFSQFVLSSCLENSSHRASLLLICIPLSIHAIGRRNQDSP